MIALFSIKPEYVEKIFSGEKNYEYRKALFKNNVEKIVIYCVKPVGMIVGEFEIEGIIEDCPTKIWNKTRNDSGVCKDFYKDYFSGRNKGYAISIGQKIRYKQSINPYEIFDSFTPPQSFCYLTEKRYQECLEAASI
uniref:Predicted transcriptional regulator, contains an HTH and PUA-like domains n=1 Tax=Candidatus Kentrum sp. TC TaxID=2126339 RepID=A0A450YCI2_9GAMM|nr:MAG: Predicted transcriptional regulator, contains an HTH and PUA-like domains [Candidatus Kentron sp. TC]